MKVYFLNLFFVMLSSCFAVKGLKFSRVKNVIIADKKVSIFITFIILSLGLVSGLRWRVGTDYWTYERIFYRAKYYDLNYFYQNLGVSLKNITNYVIANISHDPKVTFLFYSFLNSFLFVNAFKKYSPLFPVSLYLYITSMQYYTAFNIVIQYIAVGITFLYGYEYLVKKDFKKYLLVVFIASQFHRSAFILLLFYPVIIKPFKSKNKLWLIIVFFSGFLFFNEFLRIMFIFLSITAYAEYSGLSENTGAAANVLRLGVALSPLLYSLVYYRISNKKYKDMDILMNMSFINVLFVLLALRSAIFARPGFYFDIYNSLLIAKIAKNQNKNYLVNYIMMVCYLVYMILIIPNDGEILPYRTIFEYYSKF